MGGAAAKAWDRLRGSREARLLMFGLDAAGKTTMLYRLKLGETVAAIPTIGFNVETLRVGAKMAIVWDLGLRSKARALIGHFMDGEVGGLIFVVDANDRDRMEEARDFLAFALSHAREKAAARGGVLPLLVFANKTDLPDAQSLPEVREKLGLNSMRGVDYYIQGCCATTGQGLMEGLEQLMSAVGGEKSLGGGSGSGSSSAEPAAAVAVPPPQSLSEVPAEDDLFFDCFEAGQLPCFEAEEALRIAYLQRLRIPGASSRATFEVAKRLGYVTHATRSWFWIDLAYRLPPQQAESSLHFVRACRGMIHHDDGGSQESLIFRSYTREALDSPLAALEPMPPDRCEATADCGEDDEAFVHRVEALGVRAGELDSFRATARLAFALLRRCPTRRAAIQRMDAALRALEAGWSPPGAPDGDKCRRPFHETRQYAALQLVHMAMAARPDAAEFSALAAACPELFEEAYLLQYYTAQALSGGRERFVVPDRQPLPSVVHVPSLTWHQDLDDEAFLSGVGGQSLPSWGAPSLARCAYLLLRAHGRRGALERLLRAVAEARERQGLVGFAHETVAHVALHMVHFYAARAAWPFQEPFAAFVGGCGRRVLDPNRLAKEFYSEGLLYSEAARSGLVLPDVRPLPSLV